MPRAGSPPLEFGRTLPSQAGYLVSFGPSGLDDDSSLNYTDLTIEGFCLSGDCTAVLRHNVSDSRVMNLPDMLVPGQAQLRLRWVESDHHRFYLLAGSESEESRVRIRFSGIEHVCY